MVLPEPSSDLTDVLGVRPKAPKTRRGARTEQSILDAAREVFSRDGYVGARITDIAEEAGVALGTFYTYFDNKDDVLAEVIKPVFVEMYELSRVPWIDGPTVDVLRAALGGYIATYSKHAQMLRVMREAVLVDESFASYWFAWRRRFLTRIIRLIQESQDRHLVPPFDPLLMASALGGMLDDFCWIWWGMGGDSVNDRPDDEEVSIEAATELLTSLWYRALFATDVGGAPDPAG